MRGTRFLALGAMAVLLSACDQLDMFRAGPSAPPERPAVAPSDDGFPPESLELVAYYASVERGHRTRGLLRADGGGPDVPFDAEKLAATFRTTAFAREFTDVGPALVRRETASILHRWNSPVRIETIFGPVFLTGALRVFQR